MGAAFQVGERRVVRGDHPGPGPGLDGHVADRHAPFHGERLHGRAAVLDDVTHAAPGADLADDGQHQVLRCDSRRQHPVDGDGHGFGPALRQGLGGEDVLDLARADPEGQGTKRAVGRSVAVTAHDRHARLGEAQLGPDDVDDPLVGVAHGIQADAELSAVGCQHLHLPGRYRVLDRPVQPGGGDVVIHGRDGEVRPAYAAPGYPQPIKGLGRRHLVNQMEVDVQQVGLTLGLPDHVSIPNLVSEGFR